MSVRQLAAVLLACSCASLAGSAGGVPDGFQIGSSYYRVRASFAAAVPAAGQRAQRETHASDVVYRQSVTQNKAGLWEVRAVPQAGSETTTAGSARSRAHAARAGGAVFVFSRDNRPVRVARLRYDSETAGPAFLLLPLAGTRGAARGGTSMPARWHDRHELVMDQLGKCTLEVNGRVVGNERASGRNCRVVEITLNLPAGELVAAAFNASEQSKDYTGTGNGAVRSRVWIDTATGQIVVARGTFHFRGALTDRRAGRTQDISAGGTFQIDLIGTPGPLTP